MAAFHPLLGAQAFQIQPHRLRRTLRHCGDVSRRDVAGKKLDHDIGHIAGGKCAVLIFPVAHRDIGDLLRLAIDSHFRADALKTAQIVDPQCDADAMLLFQLTRQAPADADVAVVVDDFAKQGQGCLCLLIVQDSNSSSDEVFSQMVLHSAL